MLKRLRGRKIAVPVLILTAQDGIEERVRGLDAGADDYMVKPFALPELEARARALTRRGTGNPTRIAIRRADLRPGGASGPPEWRDRRSVGPRGGAAEVLVLRAGRLVSKEQLVEHLCGWGEEVSTNAIEVYIHRLRKKIEIAGVRIVTVRGLGYCLERPAEPVSGAGNG